MSGGARAGAAVKADAYGTGSAQTVRALSAAGCRDFFIAHFGEYPAIAGLVDPAHISVLHGPLTPQDAAYASATGLRPTINSVRQAHLWHEAGGGPCDVMIDTGMNRLGVAMGDIADPAIQSLNVSVLMSHLACADEDVPFNAMQRRRWEEARTMLAHREASLANSAGIALGAAFHGDLTRPGIALYGGIQRDAFNGVIAQVVQPMAAILQVRHIAAGDSVGYNATYVATRPMRIGTLAIGYADGYLRCWSGKGAFDADGLHLPVLGRVSMDMTAIDLTDAPGIAEGDWVRAAYSLPDAAAVCGLSQYELLTVLGRRFTR